MVLAVMVCFLIFRVYQVVKPPTPGPDGPILRMPGNEFPIDIPDRPGTPAPVAGIPARETWTDLTRRPPWFYRRPGQSRGGAENTDELQLTVLNFQGTGDNVRVRIRTEGSRKWYSVGDAFESYELLSVDLDTGCIEVFSEALGKRVEICKE